jgi:hypothetical protein
MKIRKSIQDIMRIPLLLNMVATINIESFNVYCRGGKLNTIKTSFENLTELYDEFLSRHVRRRLRSKTGVNRNSIGDILAKEIHECTDKYGTL